MNIDSVIFNFDMFFDKETLWKNSKKLKRIEFKGSQYEKMQGIFRIRLIKDLLQELRQRDGTISYSAAAGACGTA